MISLPWEFPFEVGVVRFANHREYTHVLAMPGPVAVCILEYEKPTGPEIRYVKVILR